MTMTKQDEEFIRDRLHRLSGKEFQQIFWDIMVCSYDDFQTPKMQNDLGNDGYTLKERTFFSVHATDSGNYDGGKTSKKMSNPSPKKGQELGDYDKFLKNWKHKNAFDVWIFVTKGELTGIPHQTLVDLEKNGDGIHKLNWGMEHIVHQCSLLSSDDRERIFGIPSASIDTKCNEVVTIMDLICYIGEKAELVDSLELNGIPDPDKKLERFSDYCDQIKREIVNSAMYAVASREAEGAMGLDKVRVEQKVLYLKNLSRKFLREHDDDPMKALDGMSDFLDSELSRSGKSYCYTAIRYYLISEIPKCNVFPNEDE